MKARDFIGYIRIIRPGSIHGIQQQYLIFNEYEMHVTKESALQEK